MTLASHSAGHPHMQNLTDDQIRFQIREVNKFLRRVAGVSPKFFRLPYGETNDRIERIVKEFNMITVYWNIDTEDSLGASQDQQVNKFKGLGRDSQDIILMHDTKEEFATQTLKRILRGE
jgi:peptidoglycan/xylan/chitin deacetylase (PgdA/CDA1 family)